MDPIFHLKLEKEEQIHFKENRIIKNRIRETENRENFKNGEGKNAPQSLAHITVKN